MSFNVKQEITIMTQTLTLEQTLLEQFRNLNPQQQQEVITFIEFLHFKTNHQEKPDHPTEETDKPLSFLEAAKEFIGCVEGPEDLSQQKKLFKRGYIGK